MSVSTIATRRAFFGMARNATAAVAVGVIGVRLIDAAEAMPVANLGEAEKFSDLLTPAQWGPGWGPPGPGWGPAPGWGRPPPPRRRRRRWVCWWHRGRRQCGWRWY